jgi:hypothetical protein
MGKRSEVKIKGRQFLGKGRLHFFNGWPLHMGKDIEFNA